MPFDVTSPESGPEPEPGDGPPLACPNLNWWLLGALVAGSYLALGAALALAVAVFCRLANP